MSEQDTMTTPSAVTGDPPTLIGLAQRLMDALASGFDAVHVADLLVTGCLQHTGAAEAGIMVADRDGRLHVLASSNENADGLERLELEAWEGPCPEAYRQGRPVSCVDLPDAAQRWPKFVPAALDSGFVEVHAVPIRVRQETVGALNVFVETGHRLQQEEVELLEVLAGAAGIGILTHRRMTEQDQLSGQLQEALDSRVVIEQAKGVLAATTGAPMNRAFEMLRAQARHERRPIADVAREVIARRDAAASVPRGR